MTRHSTVNVAKKLVLRAGLLAKLGDDFKNADGGPVSGSEVERKHITELSRCSALVSPRY
jgi:hypothetical protein